MIGRLARFALTAVGSAAALTAAVGLVTTAEGLLAWERLNPTRMGSVLPRSGRFGTEAGEAIRLGVLGDSLAVGYGAEEPDMTPGALLATWLSEVSGRPVELTNMAVIGAESTALISQLAHLREVTQPDVVVIIIGANDVMHLKRLVDALWPLSETVRDLRRTHAQAVVATCPDLGTVRPFSQPLRFFAHWYSRVLATGQAIVVLRAGGRTVSLADTLGPLFHRDPDDMFSPRDHLHPSSIGYEQAAAVILPSVLAAAGIEREDARTPHRIYRKDVRHPLAWWAFRASRRVGERLTAASSTVTPAAGARSL
ncbi:SGNH/GDSL hydrolase family protein [Microbacterium terrisoli]|uniref:SGNH/GDSL hydrolase family protein n=1 Tax=Microbacterium terrisoli TaxID=3242192 RepID=UPI002805B14E|nr:SGNH/GDSL hydrolase family protein [Microbacterium protaetiae]